MKRTSIGGLSLLAAALLVSAVTAVGAQAAPPQYLACVKAATVGKTYTGAYANKTCSETAPGHSGKYELGAPTKLPAKLKGTIGKVDIYLFDPETKHIEGHFECTSGKESGTITGGREGTATLSYSGCKATGALAGPCNSPGQKAGAVLSSPLVTRLAWLNESETEPGIQMKPASEGAAVTTVVCAGGAETAELFGTLTATIGSTTEVSKQQTIGLGASALTGEPAFAGSWEGGLFSPEPLHSKLMGLKEYESAPTGQNSTITQKGPAVMIGA